MIPGLAVTWQSRIQAFALWHKLECLQKSCQADYAEVRWIIGAARKDENSHFMSRATGSLTPDPIELVASHE